MDGKKTITFLLAHMRMFGKGQYSNQQEAQVGTKTVDCVFIGYAQRSIAYIFLVVKYEVPDMHVDSIMESRDAIFFRIYFQWKICIALLDFFSEITPERVAPTISETSEQPIECEEIFDKDDSEAPRRSKRQRVAKSFGDDFIVYLVDDTPTNIAEAYASLDADDWKEAV